MSKIASKILLTKVSWIRKYVWYSTTYEVCIYFSRRRIQKPQESPRMWSKTCKFWSSKRWGSYWTLQILGSFVFEIIIAWNFDLLKQSVYHLKHVIFVRNSYRCQTGQTHKFQSPLQDIARKKRIKRNFQLRMMYMKTLLNLMSRVT